MEKELIRRSVEKIKKICKMVCMNNHASDHDLAFITTQTSHCLFGENSQIKEICYIVKKVAKSNGPVLIRGESGTGKEILASAIHSQSPRFNKPFIAVNSGAIPTELFESELFGHVKGSFTGADRDKLGKVEEASGGTLFLDEVGDMPLLQQVKLLRMLQNGEIQPVGASMPHKIDVRIITASNRNLEEMVVAQKFREDLYFRLNLFVLTIPPLRDRKDDVLALARIFVKKFSEGQNRYPIPQITKEVESLLIQYPWPGNVRELENTLHYAVTMAEGDSIEMTDLPDSVRLCQTPFKSMRGEAPSFPSVITLSEVEKKHVLEVYRRMGENKTQTAKALRISLRSLQLKLKKWAID